MTDHGAALTEPALDLAWSLWGELGASTWARAHDDWSIELEPLMAFTAVVGPADPRLIREVVDWCAHFDDFISIHQFRNVITSQRWPFVGEVNDFSATLAAKTTRKWPGSGKGTAYEIDLTRSSRIPDFARPALIQLRLRAVLGVSARAEILRVMLTHPPREWSVTQVADRVAYTRRQVIQDLERLALARVLVPVSSRGQLAYAIASVDSLRAVFGPPPGVAPNWGPLFRSLTGTLDAVEVVTAPGVSMRETELARQLRNLEPAFRSAGLRPPRPGGSSMVEEFLEWATGLFTSLASGHPTFLLPSAYVEDANG